MSRIRHRLVAAATKTLTPLKVTLELTSRCNLACRHCYVEPDRDDSLELPLVSSILSQLHDAGCLFVTLTGGEVGLRHDLVEVVRLARARRFAVSLISNGTCWNDTSVDELCAAGVHTVRLSLYADDAEIHDKVTQVSGSWQRTMSTARAFARTSVRLELACPVLAVNLGHVQGVARIAETLNATMVIDPLITPTEAGDRRPLLLSPSVTQLRAATKNDSLALGPTRRRQTRGDDRPCMVGELGAFIRSSGEVFPCINWPESGGNIRAKPFLEIFRNSDVFRFARGLTFRDLRGCLDCSLLGQCDPCAALNLRENGTIKAPSEAVCRVARLRAQVKEDPNGE